MSPAYANGVIDAGPAVASDTEKPLALIVDDSPFLALQLARLVEAHGYRTHVPADASELRALAAGAVVIFVELELFHACGFEVTRELAANYSCPLVLLTGSGRTTDRQWGLRAGARVVLPRPVDADALAKVLHSLDGAGHS